MRKTFLIGALTLFLASCGGSDAGLACETTYQEDEIGTCLPAGWNVVSRSQLDERGVPAEVAVAFQSEKPYSGQFATVTVTRETLSQPMTTEDYSEASIASVQALPGYTEVDKRSIEIEDATIDLHVFTAQPREDQPQSRFYQVSAVSPENVGYTFTGAIPVSSPDELEEQVTTILRGVTFQEAATEEE